MGVPSDVLSLENPQLDLPVKNARTLVVVTASGGPNLLVPSPPAGFTRRCVIGTHNEAGISVFNLLGGSNVQFDLLVNANIYQKRTSDLVAGAAPQQFGNAIYLSPTDTMNGTYTSGSSALHWCIGYVDYPLSQLVPFDIPLISGDTTIVPTPPAGKSHVLDGVGENGPGVRIYNPGSNTPDVFSKVNDLVVSVVTAVAPAADFLAESLPGLAIDDATVSLKINADATGARAHGAYWVIDKGSN